MAVVSVHRLCPVQQLVRHRRVSDEAADEAAADGCLNSTSVGCAVDDREDVRKSLKLSGGEPNKAFGQRGMNRGTIGVELNAAKLGSDPKVMHLTPLVDGRLPLMPRPDADNCR